MSQLRPHCSSIGGHCVGFASSVNKDWLTDIPLPPAWPCVATGSRVDVRRHGSEQSPENFPPPAAYNPFNREWSILLQPQELMDLI